MGEMDDMMGRLQQMQEAMDKIQQEIAAMETTAESGGGMVKATVNGAHQVVSLSIEAEVIDPKEKEMLEDLVIAAVNRAMEESQAAAGELMQKQANAMLPGGLPNIPGFH